MLSKRLKILRKEANLTQTQLANSIETSQQNIGLWENGKRNPKYEMVEKLAHFFNVSTDYLLGKSDIRQTSEPEIFFRKAVSDMNLTKEQEEQFQKDIINFIEQRRKIFEEDEK